MKNLSYKIINREDNLNPQYTFDSLVTGVFNELPCAAGKAIVEKPGRCYNPLFVYGQAGVGKTHLLQAIGNQIKKTHKDKKILYIMGEDLVQDLVDFTWSYDYNGFLEKYQKYDVLIVDSLECLIDKPKTQKELVIFLSWFWNNGRQVLLASVTNPANLLEITDHLRNYCEGGMIVDISNPDEESIRTILKAEAKKHNFHLPIRVFRYLALSIKGDIRKIDGVLNNIICQSKLKKRKLNLNEIENIVFTSG